MDDEEIICLIAGEILGFLGYDVEITHDGSDAVKLYREQFDLQQSFDVVIMDLRIPDGVGGEEAVADLLKIDPDAKVIVTSGDPTDPVMMEPEKFGFIGALAKPFEVNSVQKFLGGLLD